MTPPPIRHTLPAAPATFLKPRSLKPALEDTIDPYTCLIAHSRLKFP
jgi:hypothetical protein